MAWKSVTKRILTSAWKKLWPDAEVERGIEEIIPEPKVVEEISLGKFMDPEVYKADIEEQQHNLSLTILKY